MPVSAPIIRQILAIACVTGATIVPTYINGALTVALPTIGSRIGLHGPALQWPLSVLSLVNGALLLPSGGLADATSRKKVFILGNAWIVVLSIPLAVCRQATAFIVLCAVLGLGPAMLSPSATGILSETLQDGAMKNGAFAALGAGQPLGKLVK
jgi:MFS family permease